MPVYSTIPRVYNFSVDGILSLIAISDIQKSVWRFCEVRLRGQHRGGNASSRLVRTRLLCWFGPYGIMRENEK